MENLSVVRDKCMCCENSLYLLEVKILQNNTELRQPNIAGNQALSRNHMEIIPEGHLHHNQHKLNKFIAFAYIFKDMERWGIVQWVNVKPTVSTGAVLINITYTDDGLLYNIPPTPIVVMFYCSHSIETPTPTSNFHLM